MISPFNNLGVRYVCTLAIYSFYTLYNKKTSCLPLKVWRKAVPKREMKMKIDFLRNETVREQMEIDDGMWVAWVIVDTGLYRDPDDCSLPAERRSLTVSKGRWEQLVAEPGTKIRPYLQSRDRDIRPGLWDTLQERWWLVSDKPFAVVTYQYSDNGSARRTRTAKSVQSARQVHKGEPSRKISIDPAIESYQTNIPDPDNMSEEPQDLCLVSLLEVLCHIGLNHLDANEFLWFWSMISSSSIYTNNVPVFVAKDSRKVEWCYGLDRFRYYQKYPGEGYCVGEELWGGERFYGSEKDFLMWIDLRGISVEYLYVPSAFALNVLRLHQFGWNPKTVRLFGWPELHAQKLV